MIHTLRHAAAKVVEELGLNAPGAAVLVSGWADVDPAWRDRYARPDGFRERYIMLDDSGFFGGGARPGGAAVQGRCGEQLRHGQLRRNRAYRRRQACSGSWRVRRPPPPPGPRPHFSGSRTLKPAPLLPLPTPPSRPRRRV
jgi:hypothetical protein